MTINIPKKYRKHVASGKHEQVMRFGFILVRFCREDVLAVERYIETIEETVLLNKVFYTTRISSNDSGNRLKIELIVPVHRVFGATFKPFVDVLEPDLSEDVFQILSEAKLEDVSRSFSIESQRIYFLIPFNNKSNVVKSTDNILNNYLYPE